MAEGEITEDQSALVDYLSRPGVLADEAPVRLETHGAHVFLARRTAYKLKRAIRYAYMDFSDKAKRDKAALAELDLNRRTAPDVYLGLTPVLREGDGFRLGALRQTLDPSPAVAEHLVAMRRFDERQTFDRLADAGALTGPLIDRLADAIAAFHAAAPPVYRPAPAIRLAQISGRTMQDILAGQDVLGDVAVLLGREMQAALIQAMSEVDARGAGGFIKRLHGDLHLGNVALIDDAPVIFDALEFDDDMATVDELHDLAFLTMDLWVRGASELAARSWSRYMAARGVYEGQALAPTFIAMRAAVRAKVALHAAALQTGDARQAKEAEARRYAQAALAALKRPTPRLIAIGGLSGAGKSTLARRLAPILAPAAGAIHLRSDVIRKRRAGAPFEDALPPTAYTAEESRAVYRTMMQEAESALKQGAPVILDAVFAREDERTAAENLARRLNVAFDGFWLELGLSARQGRIHGRGADASDATPAVAAKQADYDLGQIDWRRLDATVDPTKLAVAALDLQG